MMITLAVLTIAFAATSAIQVIRIGDSGARAAWAETHYVARRAPEQADLPGFDAHNKHTRRSERRFGPPEEFDARRLIEGDSSAVHSAGSCAPKAPLRCPSCVGHTAEHDKPGPDCTH
jgi:hypothetical protein